TPLPPLPYFFFYCSADHRHLHSFPTRRSSDLVAEQTRSGDGGESSQVEGHFTAAQQAQKIGDYATAEREYLSVLTMKPNFAEARSEEHTSELQSRGHLVCRLLLEKKKKHSTK